MVEQNHFGINLFFFETRKELVTLIKLSGVVHGQEEIELNHLFKRKTYGPEKANLKLRK